MQSMQQAPPTLSQQHMQPAGGKQIAPAMLDKLSSDKRLGPLLTLTFSNVWVAGLELGLLNFVGTSLQVTGLATTSATRAGFLVQLTSVLTPVVSYLAGFDIPPRVGGGGGGGATAYLRTRARDALQGLLAAWVNFGVRPLLEVEWALQAGGQRVASGALPQQREAGPCAASHSARRGMARKGWGHLPTVAWLLLLLQVWAAVAMGVAGSCLVTWDSMEVRARARACPLMP